MSEIAGSIEDFLASCRARGLSRRTVLDAYGSPLKRYFVPWCEAQKIRSPSEITQAVVDRFSVNLQENGGSKGKLSRASINSYMKAVDQFLSWAAKEGEIPKDRPKAQHLTIRRKVLDTLSREEIQRMEDAARTERDKLIIRVLADTGIRAGELVGLTVRSIVERERSFFIRVGGKTGERMIGIPKLHRRLQKFVERGRPQSDPHIFLTSRRRPGRDYEALTVAGVQQIVRAAAEDAGIDKRVYPHLLRHSFATWSLQRGVNPISLARLLGHSSLTMIHQVYSHLTPADDYEVIMRLLTEE